ncbi:MAG TPA: hypothetical protein VIY47_09590 [Ignavibacteriaceae bacterium]
MQFYASLNSAHTCASKNAVHFLAMLRLLQRLKAVAAGKATYTSLVLKSSASFSDLH